MLRSGQIGNTNFTKVIGVGHSYGSVQMQALTATVPELLDGVLLQGFSVNGCSVLIRMLFYAINASLGLANFPSSPVEHTRLLHTLLLSGFLLAK